MRRGGPLRVPNPRGRPLAGPLPPGRPPAGRRVECWPLRGPPEPREADARTVEVRFLEHGPLQVGITQVRPLQAGIRQVGAPEVGPFKNAARRSAPARLAPHFAPARRLPLKSASRARPAEVRPPQVDIPKISPFQVDASNIGTSETGPTEVSPTEVQARGHAVRPRRESRSLSPGRHECRMRRVMVSSMGITPSRAGRTRRLSGCSAMRPSTIAARAVGGTVSSCPCTSGRYSPFIPLGRFLAHGPVGLR